MTVNVGAGANIEIGAGASVTISAPKVFLMGEGLVEVRAATVNVAGGGNVNITGGIVAIN
jgi:hypothetical protein